MTTGSGTYLLSNQPVIEPGKEEKTPLEFFIEKVAGDSAFQGDLRRMFVQPSTGWKISLTGPSSMLGF